MASGASQLAHRLSALKKGSFELKAITAVDAVAFALVTVLGGLLLLYLISFNTLVYIVYQQRGAKVPQLLGRQVENSLVNCLLMLVQITEDLDSMLIELIHFYPSLKHVGIMATAFGENPEEMPNKVDRGIYLLGIVSSITQLIAGIVVSVAGLVAAHSELTEQIHEAESSSSPSGHH